MSRGAVFGDYQPTSLWQSVNATADFPLSGSIMQAMFAQVEGLHVDGVIALDAPGLASPLTLMGPVSVPGIAGPISAQNVKPRSCTISTWRTRRGRLRRKCRNTLRGGSRHRRPMKFEHIDLAALGNALAKEVEGRHLMVWDEARRNESALTAIGATGIGASGHRGIGASGSLDSTAPTPRFRLVVEHSTATTLDYYVQLSVNVKVHVTSDRYALVNTTVTAANTTPWGSKANDQTGPDGINSFTPGQYVGRVVLWSPRRSISPQSTPESGLRLSQTQTNVLPQHSQNDLVRHDHPPCGRERPFHAPIRPTVPVESHGFSARVLGAGLARDQDADRQPGPRDDHRVHLEPDQLNARWAV